MTMKDAIRHAGRDLHITMVADWESRKAMRVIKPSAAAEVAPSTSAVPPVSSAPSTSYTHTTTTFYNDVDNNIDPSPADIASHVSSEPPEVHPTQPSPQPHLADPQSNPDPGTSDDSSTDTDSEEVWPISLLYERMVERTCRTVQADRPRIPDDQYLKERLEKGENIFRNIFPSPAADELAFEGLDVPPDARDEHENHADDDDTGSEYQPGTFQ